MTQTLNSSQPPGLALNTSGNGVTWVYFSVTSLAMATCVCGLAGNSAVVWLLSCRERSTPFSIYILNLAVADFLFLLCMASMLCLETQPLVSAHVKAHEVARRVKYFAYTTSLSLLTAISAQRCLSVLFPIWYKCHRPQHLSGVVSALLWALSLFMNMLASFFCSNFWHLDKKQCFKVDVTLSTLIMGVFTPLMTVSSVILFIQVRRSSLQRRRRPRRLYVVILASVFTFLVCSLPLGIYWFVLYWVGLPLDVELLYVCLSRLFSSMSSSANPVIYFLVGSQRSRRLQEPMEAVLNRALEEEPDLEERETPSTCTSEGI
ncbi:mas-related G-protein coupled receptor member D [Ctenodactylus gundi]